MALYDRNCPACGKVVPHTEVPIWESTGWPCPNCGTLLRSARISLKLTWCIAIIVSGGTCFYFGLRNLSLVAVTLIAALPLSFIVHAAIGLVYVAPLEVDSTGQAADKPLD